jgi:hypothetical protein
MFCNTREVRGSETRTSRCRQKDSSKPLLEDIDGATTPGRSRLACMPHCDRLRWICSANSKAATMNDDLGSIRSQSRLEVRTRRRIDNSHTLIGLHSRRLSSLWLSTRIDGQLRASFRSTSIAWACPRGKNPGLPVILYSHDDKSGDSHLATAHGFRDKDWWLHCVARATS